MREFYLQNQYGQKIQLQGGSVFLYEPAGLGFEDSIEYMGTDGFFIKTRQEPAQIQQSGTLIFKPPTAYKDYQAFVNWVFSAQKITLAYKPFEQWYFLGVDILRIDKTELTIYGTLECPIAFSSLTPWYAPQNINLTIQGVKSDDAKIYDYAYPYRYAEVTKGGVIDFTIASQLPAAFEARIYGAVQNPSITAVRMDTGDVLGVIDLTTTSAEEGETIYFSNVPGQSGAWLLTSGGNVNLISQLGISSEYPTFFYLPPNVPLQMQLTAASLVDVTAALKIYRYYRTV